MALSRCPACCLFLPPLPWGLGGPHGPYLGWNQACVPRGSCCLASGPLICPCPTGPGSTMSRQLLPVLLLLLRASCPWGQEQGPKSPSEEPPEEEIPKEDGILVLSRHTLGLALWEHPALLVEFCECWGQWSWGPAETSRAHLGAPPFASKCRACAQERPPRRHLPPLCPGAL